MNGAEKPCRRCGTAFSRPIGMSDSRWRERAYCSRACCSLDQKAGRARRAAEIGRDCASCGERIVPFARESMQKLAMRRFCSQACAGAARIKVPPVKRCRCCGKSFARPIQISDKRWDQRLFCSLRCAGTEREGERKKLRKYRAVPPKPIPVRPVVYVQSVEDWLKHHRPTICPPRYAAPVMGAGPKPTGAPPQAGLNRQSMTAAVEHPANP